MEELYLKAFQAKVSAILPRPSFLKNRRGYGLSPLFVVLYRGQRSKKSMTAIKYLKMGRDKILSKGCYDSFVTN